jgi:glycosyltransferase involved in cell wall biosynthesis
VLPSFAEGIPVALMEAMAMEIPCVSTTVMGIPELIESGKDGILVPPGNVDELAAALETLIADPALRQKIGKAGRFKVAEQFNLDINVPKLQRAFMRHLAHSLAPQASATQASEASVTVVANKVPAA